MWQKIKKTRVKKDSPDDVRGKNDVGLQEVAVRFCEEFSSGIGSFLQSCRVTCCPVLADDAPSIAVSVGIEDATVEEITGIINSMKIKTTGCKHKQCGPLGSASFDDGKTLIRNNLKLL